MKNCSLRLNAGCSCPNRDGKLGTRGCIFCSAGGSGEFASSAALSVSEQIEDAKARLSGKRPVNRYIAYFQAYTNTYAPAEYLRPIFLEAITRPEVAGTVHRHPARLSGAGDSGASGGAEPDQPVWVELGLQTIHEDTARFIRRGYPLAVFERAMEELHARGIETVVHVILGLPGETPERMLDTVRFVTLPPPPVSSFSCSMC